MNITEKFGKIKKKKNAIFIATSFSFVFMCISLIYVVFMENKLGDWVYSAYLVFIFAFFGLIAYLRSKITVVMMEYNYLRMLIENQGPLKTIEKLYTTTWLADIDKNGFTNYNETEDYIIYYQYYKKVEKYAGLRHVLVVIVVAKNKNLDFYNDQLEYKIETIYSKLNNAKKIRKHIVIQFQNYNNFNDKVKIECDKIINLKQMSQTLIHLTVGYLSNEKRVYFLRPLKRYPSKEYHFTVALIKKLSYVKEDFDGEETV